METIVDTSCSVAPICIFLHLPILIFLLIPVTDIPIFLHPWNRVGGAQTYLKFVYELHLHN